MPAKTKTIRARVTENEKQRLADLAHKNGLNESQLLYSFISDILGDESDWHPQNRTPSESEYRRLHTTISKAELTQLNTEIKRLGVTKSFFISRLIQKEFGMKIKPSKAETAERKIFKREISAIGRNLNQITKHINSGELHFAVEMDTKRVMELAAHIEDLKASAQWQN